MKLLACSWPGAPFWRKKKQDSCSQVQIKPFSVCMPTTGQYNYTVLIILSAITCIVFCCTKYYYLDHFFIFFFDVRIGEKKRETKWYDETISVSYYLSKKTLRNAVIYWLHENPHNYGNTYNRFEHRAFILGPRV